MKIRASIFVVTLLAGANLARAQPPDPAIIEKYQPYLAVKKWIGFISYRQESHADYPLGGVHHSAGSTAYGDIRFTASFQSQDGFTAHWVGEEESSEIAGRSSHRKVAGGGVTAEEFSDSAGNFRQVSGSVDLDFATGTFDASGGGGDAVDTKVHEVFTSPVRVSRTERNDFFVPSASVAEAMGRRPLPFPDASGMALIGGRTFQLPKYSSPDASPELMAMVNGTTSVITVTWSIIPEYDDLELVVDIDDYKTWIPKGTRYENLAGSQLRITATLQNKDGSTTDKRATWMKYELIRTSREPGVCLNWPEKPSGPSYDLVWPVEQPQKMIFDGNDALRDGDQQVAQTLPGSYQQTKMDLACFDYGAWSTLRVTAKLEDGRVFIGHLRGSRDNVHITIPWRENGSLIAQAWKQDRRGADVADHSDVEHTAGSDWDGDGFSLYEE